MMHARIARVSQCLDKQVPVTLIAGYVMLCLPCAGFIIPFRQSVGSRGTSCRCEMLCTEVVTLRL